MNRFIILLASNSEAEKNVAKARILLTELFPDAIRFSKNHWSAAVVKEGHAALQGECARYLNAVCMAQSEKTLEDIQKLIKKAETDMGRVRGVEALGRVAIDMDLVEWNGEIKRPKDAGQSYFMVCLEDF